VGCNIYDHNGLKALFTEHRFKAVLNCEGVCALKSCELDPWMAWRVNVAGIENLLGVLQGISTRLVHLSVDLVYSGDGQGGYVENDPVDPVTVYGKTMVQSEQLILAHRPDACILRISLPMGPSFNGHAGAIDWIESRFKKGRPATLYYDEVRTPTYTDCLNRVFRAALADEISGVYHAGGPRRLSLYQIAQIINRVGGYDPRLLKGCYRHEAGPVPPRAGNVAMNSSRLARDLGWTPFLSWPACETEVPTDREWHKRR
jgi:dTDP-4-dehydrorhamnose reductase